MRLQHFMLVTAGILAILAQPLAAQMAPAKPNVVRSQVNQAQAASANSAAAAAQAPPAASATPRPPARATGGPRRDPFDPLLNKTTGSGPPAPQRLPPGKAGLMIGTLRVNGLVRGPNGMIGVVANPQDRIYFLREGDRIFDGQVIRITMEAISFQQTGRDAFGNSLSREITRRLYPSPGEQR